MDLALAGKTAVVTGASAGIGRGVARCLAKEGVRVALVARRRDLLQQFADELDSSVGGKPLVIAGDVTINADRQDMIQTASAVFGTIDILVNSAGGHRPVGLNATEDQWSEAMALNFDSQRKLIGLVWTGMRDQGWGRIINITGKSEPTGASAVFCAKAAMHAWAKGISRDLGPFGITVNSLAPGRIVSEQMLRDYTAAERAEHVRDIPAGRYGTVEEIGHIAAFLASPLASYVNGAVIPVDGGLRHYAF